MKPDWCDEATWERAWDMWRDDEYDDGPTLIARALIAAKNEGLEEAAALARETSALYPDDGHGLDVAVLRAEHGKRIAAAIRSRIQKE